MNLLEKWVRYWLLGKLKLSTMKRDATLNYQEERDPRSFKGRSFYISMFLLSFLYQFFFPSLSGSPPFIFTHRLSSCYTWRVQIAFLGLLSHPEHTGKLLPYSLSCATIVHGHFLINAVREVVVLHLMWRGWLPLPSLLTLLVIHAKSALVLLWYFNLMCPLWLPLVPQINGCSSPKVWGASSKIIWANHQDEIRGPCPHKYIF